MFFARKFEALVDQQPVNQLEESIGGLNHSTESWGSYWLNSYNTLDQGSSVIGQLAKAVVSLHLVSDTNCGAEVIEVTEVTSLLVSGDHQGEIIRFTVSGGDYEMLTKPTQRVVVVQGHSQILHREVLAVQVGEGWDEREKIFRNMFGAFTNTSHLHILVQFGPVVEHSRILLQLDYTVHDPAGEVRGRRRIGTPWNQGEELVDMTKMRLELVPGVWTLELSCHQQSVASLQFLISSEGMDTVR